MKVTVLGCGNAFSNVNFNQCFMLEECGRTMLIDYGYQAPAALHRAGISVNDINDIYISHLHGDHIGGLEQMAFLRYDWMKRPTNWRNRASSSVAPCLIANERVLADLWDKSLRGGLESMEGFDANLETFFEPHPVRGNETFMWQGWHCQLIQQIHIMTGTIISPSFGLFMSKDDQHIYFTADSQHCSPKQVEVFYQRATTIFQDCECLGVNTATKSMVFSSGVHANFAQLAGWTSANSHILPDSIKQKMYLSHYQDFVNSDKDFFGNECAWDALAAGSGLKEFVRVGNVFNF